MHVEAINIAGLFLLRLAELVAVDCFMSGTKTRLGGKWANIALAPAFALLMTAARFLVYLIPGIANEFYYITFAYYSLFFLFLTAKYRLSAKSGTYHLLLVFLCVHGLRQTVGALARTFMNGVNPLAPMSEANIALRIFVIGVYFVLCCATFRVVKGHMRHGKERMWKQLIWLLIGTVPVMYLTNLGLIMGFSQSEIPLLTTIVAQICSYCGLVIVLGYDNTLALHENEQEIIRMEMMLESQKEQYRLKRETVDILNRKYHDFKNQLLYLGAKGPSATQKAYLNDIEEDIHRYDALYQTGNEALDIILTNKGMECAQNGIRLLLLMDGSLLGFMRPLALVSIFGNAIDNAVSALETVEAGHRELTIRTSQAKDWIILRFENKYATPLKWQNGRLLSTKPDPEAHGHGLSIIERIAGEYGGNVSIDATADRFALNILFPAAALRPGAGANSL